MKAKNRYYSRSRITETKFRQIIRFFAMDLTASDTAKLTNISVRSINTIYIRLRKKIAAQCEEIFALVQVTAVRPPSMESPRQRHIQETPALWYGQAGDLTFLRHVITVRVCMTRNDCKLTNSLYYDMLLRAWARHGRGRLVQDKLGGYRIVQDMDVGRE